MGRLERHLDIDLIARVKAGIRIRPEPIKHVCDPREGSDYRAARRNASRALVWRGIKARYVPTGPRRPGKTYRPTHEREICRYLRQQNMRRIKRERLQAKAA